MLLFFAEKLGGAPQPFFGKTGSVFENLMSR